MKHKQNMAVWLGAIGAVCMSLEIAAAQGISGMYIFPKGKQTHEQQQQDEGQCHGAAVEMTGYNPSAPPSSPPPQSQGQGGATAKGALKGAAGGAALGATMGAIAGDAGKGAAMGAAGGGIVKYESAHIDGVASELIVRFGHSVQGHPKAIEEVRRILIEHLNDSEGAGYEGENGSD